MINLRSIEDVPSVDPQFLTRASFCRQILVGSEILVLIGILLSFKVTSNYSVPQYITSALITFVAAEVLEGILHLY
jgi:hypothetical protein